jgi:uncharacterized protein (TIGR02118 family)
MHKLIRLVKRLSPADPIDFHARWLADAKENAALFPGLAGYVQNHCLAGAYRKGEPIFDGFSEEYYVSADMLAARCAAVTSQIAAENHARTTLLQVTTAVLQPGNIPPGAIKSIELIQRRAGLSQRDFDRYWLEHHGPLARAIPFLRYEQNHLTEIAAASAAIDGLAYHGTAVTWFDSVEARRAVARSEAYRRIRDDERNFLGCPSSALLTTTHDLLRHGILTAAWPQPIDTQPTWITNQSLYE